MKESKKRNILISGWFGENNLGDELILDSVLEDLKVLPEEVEVTVMATNPGFIERTRKIKAVYTIDFGWKSLLKSFQKNIFKTLLAIMKADVVLIANGGALSDWNPVSMRPTLSQIFLYKVFFGKKVMLYGSGAGPFRKEKHKKTAQKYLNMADVITVRDKRAQEELKAIGVKDVILTKDSVLQYVELQKYRKKEKAQDGRYKLGIVVAPLFTSALWERHEEKYAAYVKAMRQYIEALRQIPEIEPVLIPFQDAYDRKFIQEISEGLDIAVEGDGMTIPQKLRLFGSLDFVVGMRYHAIILSVILGIPYIALVYHPKLAGIVDMTNMEDYAFGIGDGYNWKDEDLDPKALIEATRALLTNKEQLEEQLKEQYANILDMPTNGGALSQCLLQ